MSRDKYQQTHTISVENGTGDLIIDASLEIKGGFKNLDFAISPAKESEAYFMFSDLYVPLDLTTYSSISNLSVGSIPVAIGWAAGNSSGPWLTLSINKTIHGLRDQVSGSFQGEVKGLNIRWNLTNALDVGTSIDWRVSKRAIDDISGQFTTMFSGTILGSSGTDIATGVSSADLTAAFIPADDEEWVLLLKSNGAVGGNGPWIYGGSVTYERSSFSPV